MDVREEVPRNVEVPIEATVHGVESPETLTYDWEIQPTESDGTTTYEDAGRQIAHAFDDPEGATVTLTVDASGNGEPDAVATAAVETSASAVAITGPQTVSTAVETRFEARLGDELAGEDVEYEWTVDRAAVPSNNRNGTVHSTSAALTYVFREVDVYEVVVAVSYEDDGETVTKRARHTVHAAHAPASVEIGIEPPTDCQSPGTSSTTLSVQEFSLAADGVDRRDVVVNNHAAGTMGGYVSPTDVANGRERFKYGLNELMVSHKCEAPKIRVLFHEVPDAVAFATAFEVDAEQEPATAYVLARREGDVVERRELASPDQNGGEAAGEVDLEFF